MRSALALTHFAVCNALGRSTKEVHAALLRGASGLHRARPFPDLCRTPFESCLGRVDLDTNDAWRLPSGLPRQHALGLLALNQIAEPARALVERHGADRVAVLLGTSTGGIEASERAFAELTATGSLPQDYSLDRHHAFDAGARLVAAKLGVRGPVYAISTACSSSAKALAAAARLLDADCADAVLVLGVDSLCLMTLLGFQGLGVVDPNGCRPFAADRRGMTVAEGAAAVLVEREAEARVYLVGTGESSDAHHMAHPHPEGEGAHSAIEQALADAGVAASEVDYVNAHGTGTLANDTVEARVLSRIFGKGPLVSSTKAHTGHQLGTSGATEAAFCAWAITEGLAPGNGAHPVAPDLGIAVPQQAESRRIDYALSNSFAFGGSNATVLLASEAGRSRLSSTSRSRRVEWLSLGEVVSTLGQEEDAAKSLLSARALGRASPLSRTFASLLSELHARGIAVADLPLVFASAFGEMRTTLDLLKLQAEKGESSPLRFQASVHNAAQGLLSIATGHRGFATSISASTDTFAMALVEATGLVARGHDQVLVLVAEEPPLPELSDLHYPALGVALQLGFRRGPFGPCITPPFRAPVSRADLGALGADEVSLGSSPISDFSRVLAAHQRGASARVPLGATPLSTAPESRWVVDYRTHG